MSTLIFLVWLPKLGWPTTLALHKIPWWYNVSAEKYLIFQILDIEGAVEMHVISTHIATAAAKSLQSCPTLHPHRWQPTSLPRPWDSPGKDTGVWVAVSFSNAWKWKVKVKSLSCVQLLATPWTAAYQAPLSWYFPGMSTGVGCHCLLWSTHIKPLQNLIFFAVSVSHLFVKYFICKGCAVLSAQAQWCSLCPEILLPLSGHRVPLLRIDRPLCSPSPSLILSAHRNLSFSAG